MSTRKTKVAEASESLPVTSVDPALYNAFVTGIQLKRIELSELTARSAATTLPDVQLRVSQQFGVTCPSRAKDGFLAEARLQLGFQTEDGQELGLISCSYRLEYISGTEVTSELFDEFARRNVPLNAWPYLRETAMNLTQRFGWSGFVLPPFLSMGSVGDGDKVQSEASAEGNSVTPKSKASTRKPRKSAVKPEK